MRILLFVFFLLSALTAGAQTPEQQTPPVQELISEPSTPDTGACAAKESKEDYPATEACGAEESEVAASNQAEEQESPYVGMPEVMPTFDGGDVMNFHRWVMMQIRYPQEVLADGIQGRVVAEYILEKDGSVSEVNIIRSPDKRLSAEVMRVFGMPTPEWTPAMQDGKPVRMKFTIPIDFRYQ